MHFNTQLIILKFLLIIHNSSGSSRLSRRSPEPDGDGNDGGGIVPTTEEKSSGPGKTPQGQLYLPENYNKYEIPLEIVGDQTELGSLIVRVHIRIREIGDLDELDEKFSISMDARLWWTDWLIVKANQERINPGGDGFTISLDEDTPETKSKKLDPSFLQHIWKPDLFIDGLVSTSHPAFIAKPVKLVYRQDGTLVLQSRSTVTISCNMDFHYYPADTQECQFSIRSYAFESNELELEWGSPSPSVYAFDRRNTNFEIQVTEPKLERLVEPSLDVPEVTFSFSFGGEESTAVKNEQKNETFDVLVFTVKARRRLAYHLVQTYLPSVFFIGITWLCFFIPPHMVECRIGITMTTLLTLTAMFASVRESTPIVSYVKAIDIWMIACIIFVFLTLLQFSLVVWFGLNKEPPEDSEEEDSKKPLHSNGAEMDGVTFEMAALRPDRSSTEAIGRQKQKDVSLLALRLERLSILLYLALFIAFNAIYWPWLFNSAKYFEWTVDPTYNAEEGDD